MQQNLASKCPEAWTKTTICNMMHLALMGKPESVCCINLFDICNKNMNDSHCCKIIYLSHNPVSQTAVYFFHKTERRSIVSRNVPKFLVFECYRQLLEAIVCECIKKQICHKLQPVHPRITPTPPTLYVYC